MIEINRFCFSSTQPRVAQPHRYARGLRQQRIGLSRRCADGKRRVHIGFSIGRECSELI
jgi:hypothetical protein